ncbi:MAG: carbon monoxide dehydrogenase subunit G [Chloroflexi bacterium]|nr:carbon monoxide dehydrogenase subunit G [Chloroflexota bacterium]MDK1044673.1 carbon monoxide dehydrogenase subunit G [Anaerolineales bacterium]MCH8340559.1 carbon monoxide dehydrogenase subunit G [Chloroflexota bacterium]MCH8876134.1 carbon monoxide dehydrogenase subunit G [Chloroflexota bacterium]MCI0771936.1 carbon monoxide dehydrogenase subunit G [Chloroflexota bacterium]
MKLEGEVTIQADRQAVWDFLTDAEAISQCAPGLESMKIIEPDKQFEAVAAVGFGTVKVRFVTNVKWVELDPPNMAKMTAHGTAPGSAADVEGEMRLADIPEGGTRMSWSAEVVISGTLASLASRMMGSVSKKIANTFFDCVKGHVES